MPSARVPKSIDPRPDLVKQFALPLQGDRRNPSPADVREGGKRAREASKILVVEDDFLVATQAEIALSAAGFAVVGVATSADEAVQLAALQPPALVVMDIRLAGGRDGIDAAQEIFRNMGIRCIFATAHYDPDTRRRAESALPLGWLQKPYTPQSLIEMVRVALYKLGNQKR